jgi:hypothetical protein
MLCLVPLPKLARFCGATKASAREQKESEGLARTWAALLVVTEVANGVNKKIYRWRSQHQKPQLAGAPKRVS